MDTETEAFLMEGLERLMAGKTTLIIAHRLSTVRQADLIVVLRAGEIVEQGTFAELMRHAGTFASLYHTQFRTQVGKTTP
jgi:ATP-binding cassette subfamily B protein/subfamily B ATP-binding cassette protein MsbA